ncbi:MAG: hypothetical protein ERJ69_07980 [Aphanocapsa feldmannii 288cV]|nr:MAG: hypothetical protein ERJ69_07980 [Aphanocapsa feldmannii 288cV]
MVGAGLLRLPTAGFTGAVADLRGVGLPGAEGLAGTDLAAAGPSASPGAGGAAFFTLRIAFAAGLSGVGRALLLISCVMRLASSSLIELL